MKKIVKMFKNIYTSISNFINKILVIPISKLIFKITSAFDKKGKLFENWLSKSNTLLFISLVMAISIFIIIDQKIVNYSKSSAEVLQAQNIEVSYDEDNYVVEGIPESVDITLIGNKADLYIAKQSPTSTVKIDLWGLKPGTHKVDIKYEQLGGSIKYSVNPSTATVVIYDKVTDTKTLSIDLLNQDSLDQKYIIDSVTSNTDSVVIKGANYKVEQVATVKALVDVKSLPKFELGEKITVSSTLKAYDESGNVIDVEISPSKVDVDLLITSPSKEVPIKVISTGNVIYNMGISNFLINNNSDSNVTIYGTTEALSTIEYIPVNINVDGLSESTQFKVELEKPNGVKYMSVNSVTVDVNLSSDITNVDITDVGITSENLGSGYGVTPVDIDSITVKLKGVSDVVKTLTSEDIKAYVDLSGLGVGTHDVDIIVTGDDPRVEYLSSVLKMKVKIYQK
jgi:YbbR domain-containing protein